MIREWIFSALLLTGCTSTANIAILRSDDTLGRAPTSAEHVQVVAGNGIDGCIPLGRVGVTVGRPSPATALRFDALLNLKIAAAQLGAEEVRDVRFEDSSDQALWTSVTGLACARGPASGTR